MWHSNKDSKHKVLKSKLDGIICSIYIFLCAIIFIIENFKILISAAIFSIKRVMYIILLLCTGTLIIIYLYKYLSYHKRRTPLKFTKAQKKKYPIITQFSAPKGMNSAEAGLLFNGKVEDLDMLSLIYQRANDGFIKIKNNNNNSDLKQNINEIIIEKIRPLSTNHPQYEIMYFDSFFGKQSIKKLNKNSILPSNPSFCLELYCIHKGWIKDNSHIVSTIYFICSTIIFFFGIINFIHTISLNNRGLPCILLLMILFFIICIGGAISQIRIFKLTDKGAELLSHIIGYKKFIDTCDQKTIQKFLKEDPLFIHKSLPYAIAFGSNTKMLNTFLSTKNKAIHSEMLADIIHSFKYNKQTY